MVRPGIVALVACAAVLSGCGALPQWQQAGSATLDGSTGDSSNRDGEIVASEAGIRLVLPDGFAVVDGKLSDEWSDEGLETAADLMGVSPEEAARVLRQVDLYAHGPGGNINVNTVHEPARLPTPAELRALDASGPMDLDAVVDVDTPLGRGRLMRYHAPTAGVTSRGESLFILVGDRVANVTVTTLHAARSRALMDAIVPTLKPA